jgi:DNA-binding HxlR family transcriptional regulator
MEYQKKCKAGQIKTEDIQQAQHLLKCVIASLQNINVINPYATLINLPSDIAFPRKSFLLLLNFIEIITYFFQYQREQTADKETGEILIKTHPNDIELAFKFLRNNLFRRADELSTSVRGFYNWLTKFLAEAQTQQFTALDIRKVKPLNPRTLNRYLQELKLYSYIQVIGGNKHREGFIYKLTGFGSQKDVQSRIEQNIQATLKNVWDAYNNQQNPKPQQEQNEEQKEPEQTEQIKEVLTKTGAEFTYQMICSKIGAESEQTFTVKEVVAWTNANLRTIKGHLKQLTEKEQLNRELVNNQYYIYTINRASKTVSQNELTNAENLTE